MHNYRSARPHLPHMDHIHPYPPLPQHRGNHCCPDSAGPKHISSNYCRSPADTIPGPCTQRADTADSAQIRTHLQDTVFACLLRHWHLQLLQPPLPARPPPTPSRHVLADPLLPRQAVGVVQQEVRCVGVVKQEVRCVGLDGLATRGSVQHVLTERHLSWWMGEHDVVCRVAMAFLYPSLSCEPATIPL